MTKTREKTVVLLSDTLTPGVAVNTAVHLSLQAGTLHPEFGGLPVRDADGFEHSGIPVWPNIVLSTSQEDLKAAILRARDSSNESCVLLVLDYPEQGFLTDTEEEYRDALSVASRESIKYFGCLIHGQRKLVDRVIKGIETRMWNG
jgi:hypothetical protein